MAAETELERMVVRLVGDVASYQKDMQEAVQSTQRAAQEVFEASKRIEGFGTSLRGFAQQASSALAAIGFGGGMRSLLNAYSAQEDAEIGLRTALQANNRAVNSLMARYQDFATALQFTSTVGDEVILTLLEEAELFGITEEAAERAVKNAIALAKGNGEAAKGYIRLTAALEQGNTEMLRRQLPAHIRAIEDATQRAAAAQEYLALRFSTVVARAKTTAGEIRALKGHIGDLKEMLGLFVAKAILPVVEAMKNVVLWLQKLNPEIQQLIVIAAGTITVVLGIGTALAVIKALSVAAFGALASAAAAAGKALAVAFGPWGLLIAAVTVAVVALMEELGGFAKVFEDIKKVASVVWSSIRDFIVGAVWRGQFAFQNFRLIMDAAWKSSLYSAVRLFNQIVYFFKDVIPAVLDWFKNNWKNVFIDIFNLTSTVLKNLFDMIAKSFKNFPELVAGRMRWAEIWNWSNLMEGFEARTQPLVLPERVVGPLETQLRQEWEAVKDKLQMSWEEFKKQKLAQQKLEQDGKDAGKEVGKGITSGMREEIRKLDGVLFRSAEARARIAEFKERLGLDGRKGSSIEQVAKGAAKRAANQAMLMGFQFNVKAQDRIEKLQQRAREVLQQGLVGEAPGGGDQVGKKLDRIAMLLEKLVDKGGIILEEASL